MAWTWAAVSSPMSNQRPSTRGKGERRQHPPAGEPARQPAAGSPAQAAAAAQQPQPTMTSEFGSKPGSGGAMSQQNEQIERRERLRKLALETVDLSKDPYFLVVLCIFYPYISEISCLICLKSNCQWTLAAAGYIVGTFYTNSPYRRLLPWNWLPWDTAPCPPCRSSHHRHHSGIPGLSPPPRRRKS
eukprot:SAG22_NODE_3155_length_1898_cov_1.841579_2_plen_187_part_00